MTNEREDSMAAELALGLLEGDERAEAMRRQLSDPEFAREVERWRDHFATLFPQVAEVEPAPSLEARVMAANDPAPEKSGSGFWKPAAIAASLAVVGLSTIMVTQTPPPAPTTVTPAPTLVASFSVVGLDQPKVGIYDPTSARLTMPGPMPIPDDHTAQLWAAVGDEEPRALGTFEPIDGGVAAVADEGLPAGTVLMITFEPVGQPISQPTGETIAEGILATV